MRRPGSTGHGYLGKEEIAETFDEGQLLVDAISDQITTDTEVDTEPLPYEEGMAAAAEAARTWAQARSALRDAKTSQGFFRHGSGGKGRGCGGRHDSRGKGAFRGNCLRCGKAGHRARDCPQAEGSGNGAADHNLATVEEYDLSFPHSEMDRVKSALTAAAEGLVIVDSGATSGVGGLRGLEALADLGRAPKRWTRRGRSPTSSGTARANHASPASPYQCASPTRRASYRSTSSRRRLRFSWRWISFARHARRWASRTASCAPLRCRRTTFRWSA